MSTSKNSLKPHWRRCVAALACLLALPVHGATAAGLVGQAAPPLQGSDLQGQTIDLQQLRGGPVLVTFWATWCVPCRKEMPLVQAAYDKYRARRFAVVAVNVGDKAADVAAYARQLDLQLPMLIDRRGHIAERFGVIVLPTNYLIDAAGTVREVIFGNDLTAERLDGFIQHNIDTSAVSGRSAAATRAGSTRP